MRLKAYRGTHIERLYQRLAPGKGHGLAVVAVARHLAEASFWVLRKQQPVQKLQRRAYRRRSTRPEQVRLSHCLFGCIVFVFWALLQTFDCGVKMG